MRWWEVTGIHLCCFLLMLNPQMVNHQTSSIIRRLALQSLHCTFCTLAGCNVIFNVRLVDNKKALNKYIYLHFSTWWSRVSCYSIPQTFLSLLGSSWEAVWELLEYWEAAVFINGQTVAYTSHLLPLTTLLLTFPSALIANTNLAALSLTQSYASVLMET